MYIYESHMGSLYTRNKEIDWEDLHCEICGDMDWLIGYATTRAEAWDLLRDIIDIYDPSMCERCPHNGDDDYCVCECENFACGGGWSYDYVQEFINKNWNE